jgi:hypothetical protein
MRMQSLGYGNGCTYEVTAPTFRSCFYTISQAVAWFHKVFHASPIDKPSTEYDFADVKLAFGAFIVLVV